MPARCGPEEQEAAAVELLHDTWVRPLDGELRRQSALAVGAAAAPEASVTLAIEAHARAVDERGAQPADAGELDVGLAHERQAV